MIRISITGPRASGKSAIALAITNLLRDRGLIAAVYREGQPFEVPDNVQAIVIEGEVRP